MVPVLLGLPTMIMAVPPLMILIPAALALGVQIAPPVFGIAAVLALVVNCFIKSCLRFFDGVLAMRSVIGVRPRRCRHEQQKRPRR